MKNYLTFRQLDTKCLQLAEISENDINPGVRQVIINDLIMKLYGLLDGVNHPFWNTVITLTVAADQEELTDNATNGGAITAIDATAKTITRNAGAFVAGSIADVVIVTKATSLVKAQFKARITVGGGAGTYVKIGAGTEADFAGATDVCFINVMKKLSATSASLADDYVKSIVKIFDDQDTGSTERVFELYRDARAFGNTHRDPFMDERIAVYQQGESVLFNVGPTATALGIVQAEVITKPNLFTNATQNNLINTPPEENQMLTDEIVAEYIRKAGSKPIPADLAARLDMYKGRYEAAAADRAKAQELKGKRS